jgi:hypothetical protein
MCQAVWVINMNLIPLILLYFFYRLYKMHNSN